MSGRSYRHILSIVLISTMVLGLCMYLGALSSTLELGDSTIAGFLLVPALPMPLYVVMIVVVLTAVGLALLVSFLQRRQRTGKPPEQQQDDAIKTPWQTTLSMLSTLAVVTFILVWLVRHGGEVENFLERLRAEVAAAQELLAGAHAIVQQVQSPTTGYTLFTIVIVVYGGLAGLALWVLLDRQSWAQSQDPADSPAARRVRRAVQAGLRALQEHQEPRQAIIACYAHLEHLLEDHGMPVYHALTPQEYMGTILAQLELPLEAFAGLVQLFELARYSVHPLDDSARNAAITHLTTLQTHLQGGSRRAAVHA